MTEPRGGIIVGILGQWASGKSAAVKTLIGHLGGKGNVAYIDDRALLAGQAVKHLLELDESKVRSSVEGDGMQRLDGELSTVWLGPGEDLATVDLCTVIFSVDTTVLPAWLNRARVEVGHQIRERSTEGKPIVIEAGFGKNPSDHTISDLFVALAEAAVAPQQVKWIIIEADYDKRAERNESRRLNQTDITGPPDEIFAQYAIDGGDLDADQQKQLEKLGTEFRRVPNNHDDIERFRSDIIAAFEEMFGGV